MNILVTYDGSPASETALAPAVRLADMLHAEVTLLTVRGALLTRAKRDASLDTEPLERAWRKALRQTRLQLSSPTTFLLRRRHGGRRVATEILAVADEIHADLIVMATHGASGLRHVFLGSVSLSVLHRSTCPLVLVPSRRGILKPAATRSQPKIMATHDGSAAASAVLEPAATLTRTARGELLLLCVYNPWRLRVALHPDEDVREAGLKIVDGAFTSALQKAGGSLGCPVVPLVRRLGARPGVVAEILAAANEHDVDLIAMATHGHSGLRHAMVGSFALEVVAGSERPVLLVRSRSARKDMRNPA